MDDARSNLYEVMQEIWTSDPLMGFLQEITTHDSRMERLGYRKVEGVGWVRPISIGNPPRVCDRPLTKKQARRHAWEIRRRRWRNRLRDYKRRIVEAWRVLRGEDSCEECW